MHVASTAVLFSSRVQLLYNPIDYSQPDSLSMEFPRQEQCSGLPFPCPGDLPDPGIEPGSPVLGGRFSTTEPPGKPSTVTLCTYKWVRW